MYNLINLNLNNSSRNPIHIHVHFPDKENLNKSFFDNLNTLLEDLEGTDKEDTNSLINDEYIDTFVDKDGLSWDDYPDEQI